MSTPDLENSSPKSSSEPSDSIKEELELGKQIGRQDDFFSPPDGSGLDPREQFIPIGRAELVDSLPGIEHCSEPDRKQLREFFRFLDAFVHHEYHEQYCQLVKFYQPLDPDSEFSFSDKTIELCNQHTKQLFERLEFILEKANYRKLSLEDLEVAVENATALGMQLTVNFDMFEELHVYARGNRVETWTKRTWWKLFRKEEFEVDVYQRLVVAFRLREHPMLQDNHQTDVVYLKSFKSIPHSDLHALLPGTQIKMSLLDQGRIILPTLSGLAISLFKLFRFVMLMTVFATLFRFFAFLGLLIGVGLYIVKGIVGYIQTKDKYLLNLTRHLYFQNLDNNNGVMLRVLNEAESQDFIEIVYAYYMLWRDGKEGLKADELDRIIESNLHQSTQLKIDFEVNDALKKLESLKLAKKVDGKWFAVEVRQALANLDQLWDNVFGYPCPTKETPNPAG